MYENVGVGVVISKQFLLEVAKLNDFPGYELFALFFEPLALRPGPRNDQAVIRTSAAIISGRRPMFFSGETRPA
jgi:hypothetical protein